MVLMVHRVDDDNIDNSYYERNIVIKKKDLYNLIDELLDKGFVIGSLFDSLIDNKKFHISFDDGYKEHFKLALELAAYYNFKKDHLTFCINVGNSILKIYSGMDSINLLIKKFGLLYIGHILNDNNIYNNYNEVKNHYIKMTGEDIIRLNYYFDIIKNDLKTIYMDKKDIVKLSRKFKIASHGITHRDLRYDLSKSKTELIESKKILEDLIQGPVYTLCYPEGKNDNELRSLARLAGYHFGLSINHNDNTYGIGRFCVNREMDEIMGNIHAEKKNHSRNW